MGEVTAAFDGFDYARALERTEAFFWWFCDDYVELVKGRAYGGRGADAAASAHAALGQALDALQRMLAPTIPFAAEEAWSWSHESSVHIAPWPRPIGGGDGGVGRASEQGGHVDLDVVSDVLGRVRRAKTEAKVSQRATVAHLVVHGPATALATIEAARTDLADALTVVALDAVAGAELAVDVELEPPAT